MRDELTPYSRLIDGMPEGYMPVGYVCSVKALDPDGNLVLLHNRTSQVTHWEAIGMLTSHLDDLRDGLREASYAVDEDGEDD